MALSALSKGDMIATYAPPDDESSFWLARCDKPCSPGADCSVTWLETVDGATYELGEPNDGAIPWATIVCVVRAAWVKVRERPRRKVSVP
jgi:hypothetical protein